MMNSKYLSKSALKSLGRIGDLLIPGDDVFPSFTTYGCLDHIDDLVAYVPEDDRKSLNMVLGILATIPDGMLKWLIKKMATSQQNNGPLGDVFRQLNMGIRGIVFSLYYSEKPGEAYVGENPSEMIGFKLNKVV
jgi:hypothetical protein